MSIRVSDPLFLLSAQTGLSVGELKAKAAAGNPDLEKRQEALKTGEPIPILFGRFRNGSGGVMVQPKITEAYFSNSIVEKDISTDGGTVVASRAIERLELKYLAVLTEGNMPQLQVRDLFHGTSGVVHTIRLIAPGLVRGVQEMKLIAFLLIPPLLCLVVLSLLTLPL